MGYCGTVVVWERYLQGKGPSSIVGGGFPIFTRNTSNNSEVFQSLLKMTETVYEREKPTDITVIV